MASMPRTLSLKYTPIPLTSDPPSIAALLRSNECPTNASDIAFIRRSVENAKALVSDIQADYDLTQEVLADLIRDRQKLETYITERSSIISAIRRLPEDVLLEIFCHSVSIELTDSDNTPRTNVNITRSPWLLTHICSSWRAVAFDSPRLWSRLITDVRDLPAQSLLTETLQKSGGQPLSICASFTVESSSSTLDVLISHSHRWSDVDITLPSAFFPLLNKVKGNVSLLRTLAIASTNDLSWGPSPVLDAFEISPLLRTMSIVSPDLRDILVIPWSQLERLTGDWNRFEEIMDYLRRCPNIAQLVLQNYRGGWIECPTIRLPHLQLLDVHSKNSAGQHVHGLLSCITAPCLVDCSIQFADSLSPFLNRSSCSLRKLYIRARRWLDEDALISILKETPKLVELSLFAPAGFAINETLSAQLVCQPDASLPMLVPHLESLTITGVVTYTPCTSHPLIDIIKSRGYEELGSKIRSPPTLNRIQLQISPELTSSDLELFQLFRARGLRARIERYLSPFYFE